MTTQLFRTTRAERMALIACAILEAILIFGALVPAVLKKNDAGLRPQTTPGVPHD